jgi:hypothetical protein
MLRYAVIGAAALGAMGLSACTIEDDPDLAVVPATTPQVVVQPQPEPLVVERRSTVIHDID